MDSPFLNRRRRHDLIRGKKLSRSNGPRPIGTLAALAGHSIFVPLTADRARAERRPPEAETAPVGARSAAWHSRIASRISSHGRAFARLRCPRFSPTTSGRDYAAVSD